MPIYEYRCSKCGRVFEALQKFSDAPLERHPECGGEVERLISTAALKFKGSGWYVTDYAKRSPAESKADGSTEGKSNGQSEEKGEKKSEAKAESKPSSDAQPAAKSESKPASTKTGD